MIQSEVNKHTIRCSVGCLRHVIGITYWDGKDSQPEMYFETLHEPYEGFWMRIWRAWQFVVQRKPMGVDSTLISAEEALRLAQICEEYASECDKWQLSMRPVETEEK